MALLALTPVGAEAPAAPGDPQAPAAVAIQSPDVRQVSDKADAYLTAAVRYDMFSGTALIARDGAPIFVKSYGMANYELDAPNTPQTAYGLASLAKQFTAVSILQLQEQGKLKVSDPACHHLDDCPASWRQITIRHLLNHTSGVPNFSSLPGWDEKLAMLSHTQPELVRLFRDLPLQFTPGEKFKYSNSGYFLLGMIVERVSSQRFDAYLEDHIFKPAGMTRSQYEETRALVPGRATGYYSLGTEFINGPLVSPSGDLGNSGIYSTVGDLLLWDKALATNRLVSRKSQDEMFTPAKEGYGFGWHIGEKHGRLSQSHAGSGVGASSYIIRFPDDRTTVIVLSNSDRTNAGRIGLALSAIAFGLPHQLPVEQLGDVMWNLINQQGVAAALKRHAELKRTAPSAYDFGDETLLDVGYNLIEARKLAEATAIFDYNLIQYPTSAYNYDGLADIALARGNKPRAMALFEKSLGMDSKNEYAIDALAKLRADGLKAAGKP